MPSVEAPNRRDDDVVGEFRDEGVVSLEPPVREALERVSPEPSSRWRILAYKWFVLIRRTD
jgi:hypothetical protein